MQKNYKIGIRENEKENIEKTKYNKKSLKSHNDKF